MTNKTDGMEKVPMEDCIKAMNEVLRQYLNHEWPEGRGRKKIPKKTTVDTPSGSV